MKRINEMFASIQGEGFHTGTPAFFIRFSGCNCNCPFCDTNHEPYTELSEEEIAEKAKGYDVPWVILTGGEPSLQVSEHLIDLLHQQGKKVAIETNGTHEIPQNIDWITCSPKEELAPILKNADEVKVVYQNSNVEHWHNEITAQHYYLQPCSCTNTEDVIDYIMKHPHWRLSIQVHKYLNIK
ncbi:MAG: radical SAM protein [Paludibacteraceae bacterium]|nr:radical SAM protein [Paludibacteraceae bacterium]